MKKARMNISHSRFILFKLKIFGEIVTTIIIYRPIFKLSLNDFERLLTTAVLVSRQYRHIQSRKCSSV